VSNVTNECSVDTGHTVYLLICVKNCWQDCPAQDVCSSAPPELYPRLELSIAICEGTVQR